MTEQHTPREGSGDAPGRSGTPLTRAERPGTPEPSPGQVRTEHSSPSYSSSYSSDGTRPQPSDAERPASPDHNRPLASDAERSAGPDGTRPASSDTAHPSSPDEKRPQPSGAERSAVPGEGRSAARRHAPADVPSHEAVPDGAGPQTDRLRYLDVATRRIARGMDLDETLLELRRAAVPSFADAIFVHLHDPLPVGQEKSAAPVVLQLHSVDRAPETSGTGSPAPSPPTVRPLHANVAERVHVTVTGRLAELLLAGRPAFGDAPGIGAAVAELLGPVTGEPGTLPPGRRLIIAPLYGRHHVMGTVVLLRRPEHPAFTEDDLLVASQLATHTAIGVQKAVMYGHEAAVADTLQRTMLPSSLPEPTGVRLASRYLPASRTAQVGGDWYDAIPVTGNRIALVVGDVMGHSMTSAAIMGQLRTTVQTLAGLDLPPDEVLHHLDEQARRLGSDHIATCLYAIYDPISHRLLMANAGHPPAVLLHPDGRTEILRVPPGPPIGVGDVLFESVEMPAPTGATLLLYTDGLVETRDTDVGTGVEALRRRLETTVDGRPTLSLELLCDQVVGSLGPAARDDDIALLAARFEGFPPDSVAYWFLDPRPRTAGQARRLARRALHRWGLESLLDTTELMVSEVVTNAVRFASRPISLRLLRTDVLRCEVTDDSPEVPRMRHAAPGDEGGRGLFLVSQLARRWGATRLSTGKVVWFEQPIPRDQQPSRDQQSTPRY
ncbi:SpoIIE family protein phosphatase [Streptomyces krungchingensis]|uniref:SpoIIE family protein phosphatase n=1 Tax=Streptomyces krungchingensis TaxID=1565034 RepID=UPI003CEA33A6